MRIKLGISNLRFFDPRNHMQGSAWWQFCVLMQNMEDPRLSAGMNILTVIQISIMLSLAVAITVFSSPKTQDCIGEGVTASERPNKQHAWFSRCDSACNWGARNEGV